MIRGQALEFDLDVQHAAYHRDDRARMWRTYARRDFRGAYTGDAPPDYLGVLYSTGQAVAIEAKSTQAQRWAVANLHLHQRRDLEAVRRGGGLALVVLRIPAGTWAVPVDKVPSRGTLGVEELAVVGRRLVGVDWMPCSS
jgi:penicillin-binding protein-related factor A (putative recombinase)